MRFHVTTPAVDLGIYEAETEAHAIVAALRYLGQLGASVGKDGQVVLHDPTLRARVGLDDWKATPVAG